MSRVSVRSKLGPLHVVEEQLFESFLTFITCKLSVKRSLVFVLVPFNELLPVRRGHVPRLWCFPTLLALVEEVRERGGKGCLTVCEVQRGRAGYHHSHWSTLEFSASSKAFWREQRRNAFPKTWFGPVHAFSRQEKDNSVKRPSFESWIGAGISLDTGVDLSTQCALQRVLARHPSWVFSYFTSRGLRSNTLDCWIRKANLQRALQSFEHRFSILRLNPQSQHQLMWLTTPIIKIVFLLPF